MALRRLMSGNEAIARGAFEAGVTVGAGYPGTPSTEILESLAQYKPDVYCEWSPNERWPSRSQQEHPWPGLAAL